MKEHEVSLLNAARLVNMADQILYPMIDQMIQHKLEEATAKFRGGKAESFIHEVSYMAALQDLRQRLTQIQKKGNKIIEQNQETTDV